MINKYLLERIYDSAYVQRWNDKYRPVEFNELDKQAHKMTIAYLLGKFEEGTEGFNWVEVIETGIGGWCPGKPCLGSPAPLFEN